MSNQNNDNEMLFKMIQDNFNNLRSDLHERLDKIDKKFDKIEGKLDEYVKLDDCKKNRKNCLENLNLKRSELSIKKITAIGGVVTGFISANSIIIVTVLKIFYPM